MATRMSISEHARTSPRCVTDCRPSSLGVAPHASREKPIKKSADSGGKHLLDLPDRSPTETLYYSTAICLTVCAFSYVYLVRTKNVGITYSAHAPNAYELTAKADTNWSERRSATGFAIMLAGASINPASLTHSRRQHCITMSSTEAELVGLADCAIELIHVDGTLHHIGYRRKGPIKVGTDNKGAHDLCHRFTSAQNSRHINRKLFKMRELRGAGMVTVEWIPTELNLGPGGHLY